MGTVSPARRSRPSHDGAATPSKGEQTRAAILDAALGLFEEAGYDATTMRAVAERAGVSVGNAYYYFDSKEHLIQGFYDRVSVEHDAVSVDLEHAGRAEPGVQDAGGELLAGHGPEYAPHVLGARVREHHTAIRAELTGFEEEEVHARFRALLRSPWAEAPPPSPSP